MCVFHAYLQTCTFSAPRDARVYIKQCLEIKALVAASEFGLHSIEFLTRSLCKLDNINFISHAFHNIEQLQEIKVIGMVADENPINKFEVEGVENVA
jgi:hypothetical protein